MQLQSRPLYLTWDLITEIYIKSSPDGQQYPEQVKKKMNAIRALIKQQKFSDAFNLLTEISSLEFRDYSYDEFQLSKMNLKIQTILKNFSELVEQLRKKEEDLQKVKKRQYQQIPENHIKTAIFDAFSQERIEDALMICQNKGYQKLAKVITDAMQYRWLIKRDQQIRTNTVQFRKWNENNLVFQNGDGIMIKAKLQFFYKNIDNLSVSANVVLNEYFQSRDFKKTCQVIWRTFTVDQLRIIFEKNWDFFQYAKMLHQIEETLLRNKIIQVKLKDEQRAVVLTKKVEEMVSKLSMFKLNERREGGAELSEQEIAQFTYKHKPINSYINESIKLQQEKDYIMAELTHLSKELGDHKHQIKRIEEEREQFKQDLEKELFNRFKQSFEKKINELQRENEQLSRRRNEWDHPQNFQNQHLGDMSNIRNIEVHPSIISNSYASGQSREIIAESEILGIKQFQDVKKKIGSLSCHVQVKKIYIQKGISVPQQIRFLQELRKKDFLIVMKVLDYEVVIYHRHMIVSAFQQSNIFEEQRRAESDVFPQYQTTKNGFIYRIVAREKGKMPSEYEALFVPTKIISVEIDNRKISIGDLKIELDKGELAIQTERGERSTNFKYRCLARKQLKIIRGMASKVNFSLIQIFQIQNGE